MMMRRIILMIGMLNDSDEGRRVKSANIIGGSFNIIWTDPSPYTSITSETSEDCAGLDA
jgi:hypothetical protein